MPKSYPLVLILSLLILILTSCKDDCENGNCPCDDPCSNPEACPGQCDEALTLSKDDLSTEGEVIDLDNGFSVKGELKIANSVEGEADIVFEDADMQVIFNQDGTIASITGEAIIPSPSPCIEFTQKVRGEINFYSGEYINENLDLDITLKEEISYFVMYVATEADLTICSETQEIIEHEPFHLKPPTGGRIVFVSDFKDPMFYFLAEQDLLGLVSLGISAKSQIPYVPFYPVDQIVDFEGQVFVGKRFSMFKKLLSVTGHRVYTNPFSPEYWATVLYSNPGEVKGNFGVNGEIGISPIIEGLSGVDISLAGASAAVYAELTVNEKVTSGAFINGFVGSDANWLPEFIPLRPGAQIHTSGFVDIEGNFELTLGGNYTMLTPEISEEFSGEVILNNSALTSTGQLSINDTTWYVKSVHTDNLSEYSVTVPENIGSGMDNSVEEAIDNAINESTEAYNNLVEATENYELELSLRGFREELPGIISGTKSAIASAIDAAINSGKAAANKRLAEDGFALCGDNISSIAKSLDNPYVAALNRLQAAVNETNDDAATRIEMEAALRDLASKAKMIESKNATITPGSKETVVSPKCTITFSTFTVKISVNQTILSSDVVTKLIEAADNVKFIEETSDLKVSAQEIFDLAPSPDDLNNLKDDILNGVVTVPEVEEVILRKDHINDTYTYYLKYGEELWQIPTSRLFHGTQMADAIVRALL